MTAILLTKRKQLAEKKRKKLVTIFLLSAGVALATTLGINAIFYGLSGVPYPGESLDSSLKLAILIGGGVLVLDAVDRAWDFYEEKVLERQSTESRKSDLSGKNASVRTVITPIPQRTIMARNVDEITKLWKPIFATLNDARFALRECAKAKSDGDRAIVRQSAREIAQKLGNWSGKLGRLDFSRDVEDLAQKISLISSCPDVSMNEVAGQANTMTMKLTERVAKEMTRIWVESKMGKAKPDSWMFESIDDALISVEVKGRVVDASMVIHHFKVYIDSAGVLNEGFSAVTP